MSSRGEALGDPLQVEARATQRLRHLRAERAAEDAFLRTFPYGLGDLVRGSVTADGGEAMLARTSMAAVIVLGTTDAYSSVPYFFDLRSSTL